MDTRLFICLIFICLIFICLSILILSGNKAINNIKKIWQHKQWEDFLAIKDDFKELDEGKL